MNRIINMNTHRTFFCAALGLMFLLRITTAAGAQETGGPRVVVRTSPELPAAGSTWTLLLLVEYPVPEDVSVQAPAFGESLLPDRLHQGPYTSGPLASPARPWTSIEYRFLLTGPGIISLEPFIISTPLGQSRTAPLVINAQGPRQEAAPPRFRLVWDGVPPGLSTGESAEFNLRLNGGTAPLPEPELFIPPVPAGFILEPARLSAEDRSAGVALRLRIIPLNAEVLFLPGKTVSFENAVFEIPPLSVPVLPGPGGFTPDDEAGPADGIEEAAGSGDIPFPEFEPLVQDHPFMFKWFRKSFEMSYNTAAEFWDQGYRAEALAELRRNERDHPAGFLFRPLREAAEFRLALDNTAGEKPRYRYMLFFFACTGLALITALAGLGLAPLGKKVLRRWAVLLAAAGLLCLGRFALGERLPGRSRQAVLKETAVRRIPDPAGEIIARWGEGQPARLPPGSGKTGSWLLISTPGENGSAGWVWEEKIILY
jgi:hypothetical protein